jgi:hypothetical protein
MFWKVRAIPSAATVQTVECRGLPCTIWADYRKQFAFVDRERDVGERLDTLERQAYVFELEEGCGHESHRFLRL